MGSGAYTACTTITATVCSYDASVSRAGGGKKKKNNFFKGGVKRPGKEVIFVANHNLSVQCEKWIGKINLLMKASLDLS